jgi:hypothetical protein
MRLQQLTIRLMMLPPRLPGASRLCFDGQRFRNTREALPSDAQFRYPVYFADASIATKFCWGSGSYIDFLWAVITFKHLGKRMARPIRG